MKFKRIFSITLIVALILSIASINTVMASNTTNIGFSKFTIFSWI